LSVLEDFEMRVRLLSVFAAAALALGLAAAPAMAQRGPAGAVATVEAPFAAAERIITGTIVWNCDGPACRAGANQTNNVRACRQLARQAGRITAYSVGDVAFTADQLASCNTAARPRS
jgi:hypothetical protein